VDRIARVWHQHHVAGRGDRLRHVGEALLRAERGDDLRLGLELDAEAAGVIASLGPEQARNALGGRVAIRARLAHRLDQLVDDVLGRRLVGIAHAEIDDVRPASSGRRLQPVDLGENVRWQSLDAVKILDHGLSRHGVESAKSLRGRPLGMSGAAPQRVYARPASAVQTVSAGIG
jgi:hypothetical protein